MSLCFVVFFFFKQKTAYEMRISDWSSDVCSSDLQARVGVSAQDNQLLIHDLESGELIATHDLCKAKGRMIKNNNHYRDHAQRITDLERGIDSSEERGVGKESVSMCRSRWPGYHEKTNTAKN